MVSPKTPKVVAQPFDALMGVRPVRLPSSPGTTVVVCGQVVTDVRQVDRLVGGDDATAQHLRDQVLAARARAAYQRERTHNPEAMARRKAREQSDPEVRREYMRRYRAEHRDRINEINRNWARANYHRNAEAAAARARDWYAANREKAQALARDRYQRNKAAKAAKAASDPTPISHERTE